MRKVNADLHNHLRTLSDMSKLSFNEVIDIAKQRLGAGGILGIVNFNDERYEQFSNLPGYERQDLGNGFYVPEKDILVVKGQEIPTKQGHILVLGIEKGKHLKPGKDLEETIKESLDNDGIIIMDHPFYHAGVGEYIKQAPILAECFDGIEVYNSEAELYIPRILPRNANEKARKLYEEVKEFSEIGALFSSDGHSLAEIGRSYTQLEMPEYGSIRDSNNLTNHLRNAIRLSKAHFGKAESSKFRASMHAGFIFFLNILKMLRIYTG